VATTIVQSAFYYVVDERLYRTHNMHHLPRLDILLSFPPFATDRLTWFQPNCTNLDRGPSLAPANPPLHSFPGP
jgi:hypothetical protein